MKPDIHPEYHQIEATCVCGNVVKTGSVMPAIKLEICSACHPFFSGVAKFVDTEGRVEQFKRRFGNVKSKKKTKGDQPQDDA
ncbi:MAG: 50S ribosomal protein L31 [Cyanobacteria bacterium HKST-UBA06]|nr:50S ribosomal protein L31 [Cyanobacteria bacterium HKST-UBA06]